MDISEFLIGIRGDLNDRRKKLVRMAFDRLDKDKSGSVTVDELMEVYDVSWNPEVKAGKKTPKEAMKDFMAQWDRLDQDGVVTPEEFEDYYKEVSASIDGDDYFELMIRNAWRIAGGEGACANTANKRVLVTRVDGSQSVETVQDELGMRPGDKAAVMERLARQGVQASSVELHGGVDTTEKAAKQRVVKVIVEYAVAAVIMYSQCLCTLSETIKCRACQSKQSISSGISISCTSSKASHKHKAAHNVSKGRRGSEAGGRIQRSYGPKDCRARAAQGRGTASCCTRAGARG